MSKLVTALQSVDWNGNVADLCGDADATSRIELCNLRVAMWSRQLELIGGSNPALSFVREMQHGGHNVACALALALYKPAAAGMRSLVECALYFCYFRSHPEELSTLVRDPKYYVSKREVLAFFGRHVPEFQKRQSVVGFVDRLEAWYSETSAIVHGQIPGVWTNGASISAIKQNKALLDAGVQHFERASMLVQDLFICVLGGSHWPYLESDAKALFCKAMSGEAKTQLGLDTA